MARRDIDVCRQRNLTVLETYRLCVKGILHRLLRSVLTLAVVVLAVAFFMFLMAENAFLTSGALGVIGELNDTRRPTQLLGHLLTPTSSVGFARRLSDLLNEQDAEGLNEIAAVTGASREQVDQLAEMAATEYGYLTFFDNLSVGNRLILVQRREGRAIFRRLKDDAAMSAFAARLAPMLNVELPGGLAAFREFIEGFGAYEQNLSDMVADWNQAVAIAEARSSELAKGQLLEQWFPRASNEYLDDWRKAVSDLGFHVSVADVESIVQRFQHLDVRQRVVADLNSPELRQRWRQVYRERRPSSLDSKIERLHEPRAARVLEGLHDPEGLARISRIERRERRLADLERLLAPLVLGRGGMGISGRQLFLLIISFVVCMVGIANAMLMAITERFREIATMKCLGATDRYILLQFMMEAGLQGICGGVLGMLIGFLIAVSKSGIDLGGYLFTYWPMTGVLISALVSVVAGVVLAVCASIYPSWAASRMAPMEAMRVE